LTASSKFIVPGNNKQKPRLDHVKRPRITRATFFLKITNTIVKEALIKKN
jgi:hypothetical protein